MIFAKKQSRSKETTQSVEFLVDIRTRKLSRVCFAKCALPSVYSKAAEKFTVGNSNAASTGLASLRHVQCVRVHVHSRRSAFPSGKRGVALVGHALQVDAWPLSVVNTEVTSN